MRQAPRSGSKTSGRLPAVPLLLLLVLLVAAAGGALPARAADDGPKPLDPRRLFDQSRPGVELITAKFSAQLVLPEPTITVADQQALQARVAERVRRGEIPPGEIAVRSAGVEELVRDPFRWFTASPRLHREKIELSLAGSGFSISPDGYIVTNAHVAAPRDGDLKAAFVREMIADQRDDFIQTLSQGGLPSSLAARYLGALVRWATRKATLSNLQRRLAAVTDSGTGGIAVAEGRPATLVTAGKELPGKDVAILKVEASNMATVPLGDDTALGTGDRLFVLGFPAPATFNPALSKDSQKEPTLTQGVLSAKKTVRQGFTVLQTDAAMTHGNSGGPVFDEQGRVVGVATFGSVDPSTGREVAGLNFAVPVSVVNELLSGSSLTPVEGEATNKWRMALDAFDKHWYKRALPLFERVKALDPNHPLVDKFIGASQAAIGQGRDRTPREVLGLPIALFVAVTASVGLLVVGFLVAMSLRRRRRSARRRGVPATAVAQPGRIPSSITDAPTRAALETRRAVEPSGWLDQQPLRADRPTDPRGSAGDDAGASREGAAQTRPTQPWWPPEQPAAEPSASPGGFVAPRLQGAGQAPPQHGGQPEWPPDRRIVWSDLTRPSEPPRAPLEDWGGRAREHQPVQPAPAALLCWSCGHQSPPALRFCERCWNLLRPEE